MKETIRLRGHHIVNILRQKEDIAFGLSEENIIKELMTFGERGKAFEEYFLEIFNRLHGKNIGIVFTDGLDDICLGPYNTPPGEWCKSYSVDECLGKSLLRQDEVCLSHFNFSKNGPPITSRVFLERIKDTPSLFHLKYSL